MTKNVEYEDLPATSEGFDGAVAVQITADTRDEVQAEINRIFEKTCESDGVAEFRNPFRSGDRWQSRGFILNARGDK
jgi:hypothetical protein